MDFKLGDDIDENGPIEHKLFSNKNKNILIISCVIFLLLIFLVIFIVISSNSKSDDVKEPTKTKTTLTLDNSDVIESYQMITYGYNNCRFDKFMKGISINNSSFTNQEKFIYALQFAVKGDFSYTSEVDNNGTAIYSIPKKYMDIYMNRMFGKDMEYEKESDYTITFKFNYNNMNTGNIKYDVQSDEYRIVFNRNNTVKNELTNIYYFLNKAYIDGDNLILVEKVLYTKMEDNNGKKTLYLFSDYDNKSSIGTIDQFSEIDTADNSDNANLYAKYPTEFDIDSYKEDMGTITYTFKANSNKKFGYYFVSSEVSE